MKRINRKQADRRIAEAKDILRSLGLPEAQQRDLSALTFLALLDMTPQTLWSDAQAPLRGTTQLMKYFASTFGREYAPNTREDVRRTSLHQFRDAAIIVQNPDKPDRSTNSGKNVYQITPEVLDLIRSYGSKRWKKRLEAYGKDHPTLSDKYRQEREVHRIPVTLPGGNNITLSPGGQNPLIKKIIEEFCPIHTPDAAVLFVGDTASKSVLLDEEKLSELGVEYDHHGKMPDVVVFFAERGWLVLIEAVTSHGPVNPKRHNELRDLFQAATVGIVYVTAFMTRKDLSGYLNEISWETEVWVAESPTHLIHFDGERFLGPY